MKDNKEIKDSKVALLMQSAVNGGVQKIIINLAKGMIKKGLKVDLLIADATGEMRELVPDECAVYDFKKRKYHGDLKVLMAMPDIAKYIKQNPGITILAAPGLSCSVLAFLKIFNKDLKAILINDNKCSLLWKKTVYHKAVFCINAILYRFADYIVAAHTPAKDDIIQWYKISPDKIKVIYHPLIDLTEINEALAEKEHPFIKLKKEGYKLVLAVGRLVPEKAYDNLIKAIQYVKKEEKVKLIILGEGQQRKFLESCVKKNGLESDIKLYGYTDKVFQFMKSSDLFVLSSRQEAFGNVLIEAIACGVPCVATDCDSGGPREIMESHGIGKYGVLCDCNDAQQLANAIIAALKLDYNRKLFEEKAIKFTIDHAASEYLNVIRKVNG